MCVCVYQDGLVPTLINYNTLIEACSRANDPHAAQTYFTRLQVRHDPLTAHRIRRRETFKFQMSSFKCTT